MLGIIGRKHLLTMGIMGMATARLLTTPQRHLVCLGEHRLHMKEVTLAQRKHGSRDKPLERMV